MRIDINELKNTIKEDIKKDFLTSMNYRGMFDSFGHDFIKSKVMQDEVIDRIEALEDELAYMDLEKNGRLNDIETLNSDELDLISRIKKRKEVHTYTTEFDLFGRKIIKMKED